MASFDEITERVEYGSIVAVGGDVSAERIVRVLRVLYMGGVKSFGFTSDQIPCEGTVKFYQCQRRRFKPGRRPRASEVIELLRHDDVTYEVGLRWFLTNPTEHLHGGNRPPIYVLSRCPIVKDGFPQALTFRAGGDAPYIRLDRIDPEKDFPGDGDILTAYEIRE